MAIVRMSNDVNAIQRRVRVTLDEGIKAHFHENGKCYELEEKHGTHSIYYQVVSSSKENGIKCRKHN